MKNFVAALTTALEAEAKKFFWAVELYFDSFTYRYNNSDIERYLEGNSFDTHPLQVNYIQYTAGFSVGRAEFVLAAKQLRGAFVGEDIAQKRCRIGFFCTDSDYTVIALQWMFDGLLFSYEMDDIDVIVRVVNDFHYWQQKPLRIAQASCPWPFKGTECGYAGAGTWCDQSYVRCGDLGNTNNYGGFRFLPYIAEKKIWWGRTQG